MKCHKKYCAILKLVAANKEILGAGEAVLAAIKNKLTSASPSWQMFKNNFSSSSTRREEEGKQIYYSKKCAQQQAQRQKDSIRITRLAFQT